MKTCKHNLHARVIWTKGSTPLTALALRTKHSEMWKNLSVWGVMSLNKGFYEFSFSCLENVKKVRSIASWNLNLGLLKLFTWTNDFSPSVQNSSSAQVWVRIHALSQEYWRPKILFAIANGVGTPICIDAASSKPMVERTFEQFARVLVDMDLSQNLRYKVLVERKNYAFFVNFEYENLLDFCTHYNKIGHYIEICKFANNSVNNIEVENQKKNTKEERKGYVQVKDGRTKQGGNVENPIIVNENVEGNINATLADKGKATFQQTDLAGTSTIAQAPELMQKNSFDASICAEVEHQDDIRNTMVDADKLLENEVNSELEAIAQISRNETEDNSPHCSEFVADSN